MRIISKFNDYYDGAQGYGIDKELVYLRKTEESKPPSDISTFINHYSREIYEDNGGRYLIMNQARKKHRKAVRFAKTFIVGFCGEIRLCVKVTEFADKFGNIKEHYCYTREDINEHLYVPDVKFNKGDYFCKDIRLVFDRFDRNRMRQYFIDHRVPCFVSYSGWAAPFPSKDRKFKRSLIHNPCLKDIQFYKVHDAYSAFQEISMFMGSLGKDAPEMDNIADEHRIAGHGFDKFSFRKLPTKRRK